MASLKNLRFTFLFLSSLVLGGCASNLKNKKEIEEIEKTFDKKFALKNAPKLLEKEERAISPKAAPKAKDSETFSDTERIVRKKDPSKAKNAQQSGVKLSENHPEDADKKESVVEKYTWPFGVGEKLSYVLRYGPIEGGVATLEVGALQKIGQEPVLHYIATAKSYKFFDFFYKVDNKLESWVRIKDHQPLRQEIHINESGQWGKRVIIFDPDKKQQKYYSHITRKGKKAKVIDKTHSLVDHPQDIFGAGYYYRFFESLDNLNYPVHDRTKHWNNRFEFLGKEQIKIKGKSYATNKFKLYPRVSGKEKLRGDITVWLSDDSRQYMVKFKGKIAIGSITGELVKFRSGRDIAFERPKFQTPIDLDEMGVRRSP